MRTYYVDVTEFYFEKLIKNADGAWQLSVKDQWFQLQKFVVCFRFLRTKTNETFFDLMNMLPSVGEIE